MTKLKNSKCDKIHKKKLLMWKNSECDKTKKTINLTTPKHKMWQNTKKLKMWQNSKAWNVKNSKIRMWHTSTTQNVTRLKKLKFRQN